MELISREAVWEALLNKGQSNPRGKYKLGDEWELNAMEIKEAIAEVPTIGNYDEQGKTISDRPNEELISRNALLKQIEIDSEGNRGQYGDEWFFLETIEKMPIVESRPKGKWITEVNPNHSPFDNSSEYIYHCSNCGRAEEQAGFYCRMCGAEMESE